MTFNRVARGILLFGLTVSIFGGDALAQSEVDTLMLVPLPLDSVYIMERGGSIVVGWYANPDSLSAGIGSRFYSTWYGPHDRDSVSVVTVTGDYIGDIDRTLRVYRQDEKLDPILIGTEPSFRVIMETVDRFDTWRGSFQIGADFYTPGSPIRVKLPNAENALDTLDLGIMIGIGAGIISSDGLEPASPAYFEIDLQDFEGFHIWRGLSPSPSRMRVIEELSKEDAFKGYDEDSLYFHEWPQLDARGRRYFEYVDDDVFVGFTYYYIVTTFDRGYFRGNFIHNKWDCYICEDPDLVQYYGPPGGTPLDCGDAAEVISMSVPAGTDMKRIFTVPNPYRTGTSSFTTPYYHNFPDRSIKFYNVPQYAQIKIFTVAGDLVWETVHEDPVGDDGVVNWNTMNLEGNEVSSGVYIYRVERNNGEDVYGRIVIIR